MYVRMKADGSVAAKGFIANYTWVKFKLKFKVHYIFLGLFSLTFFITTLFLENWDSQNIFKKNLIEYFLRKSKKCTNFVSHTLGSSCKNIF